MSAKAALKIAHSISKFKNEMGLLEKIGLARKTVPQTVGEYLFMELVNSVFGSNFGISVSPKSILQIPAVYAACAIRGQTLATFPIKFAEKGDDGKSRPYHDKNLARLLKVSPDGEANAVAWFQSAETSATLHGHFRACIERDAFGNAVNIVGQDPGKVRALRDRAGVLYFEVQGQRWEAADVINITSVSLNGIDGLAPSKYLSDTLSLARAIDIENANFFKNGCSAGRIFENPNNLKDDQIARFKKQLKEYEGVANAGKNLILAGGLKLAASRMSNKDAQTTEQKNTAIREISAWSGVPAWRLGDGQKSNYASQEESNRDFIESAMLYRVRVWESEFSKLNPREMWGRRFVQFNYSGLLRGSAKDRADFYWKMYQMSAMSDEEIRELEDMPPKSEAKGNFYNPLNMQKQEIPANVAE